MYIHPFRRPVELAVPRFSGAAIPLLAFACWLGACARAAEPHPSPSEDASNAPDLVPSLLDTAAADKPRVVIDAGPKDANPTDSGAGGADVQSDGQVPPAGDARNDSTDVTENPCVAGCDAAPGATGLRLAMTFDSTCLLRANGTVACWGLNDRGQLGTGDKVSSVSPRPVVGLSNVVDIAGTRLLMCAALSNGEVRCWGNGNATPAALSGATGIIQISGHSQHHCGLQGNGGVLCWGSNAEGQLGGGTAGGTSASAVKVIGVDDAVSVGAGHLHSCALRRSGEVACWGDNGRAQLGIGTNGGGRLSPVAPKDLGPVKTLAVGGFHTCGQKADGKTWCWGSNWFGEGGTGTRFAMDENEVPTLAAALPDNIVQYGMLVHVLCAVTANGAVRCCGKNANGQVGVPPSHDEATPKLVITDGIHAAGGEAHTCAVRRSGRVACWGDNTNGQLGDGTKISSFMPVDVAGL
jgi:alpha-tubulin suppressor-like RCC1 family protein